MLSSYQQALFAHFIRLILLEGEVMEGAVCGHGSRFEALAKWKAARAELLAHWDLICQEEAESARRAADGWDELSAPPMED